MHPVSRPVGARRLLTISVGLFLLAGVVGAVIWQQIVDVPTYTRMADNGSMEALELSRSVAIDGWYAVIAVVLAIVLGAVLTVRASGSPRLNVLALLLGSSAAGLLMLAVGHWLGPGDVEARLAAATEGDRVPAELVPNSGAVDLLGVDVHTIFLVWPIAALVGAALVLVFGPPPAEEQPPG